MTALSVLIVDDNEVDRELLRRDLKKTELDAMIFEVSDGEQALKFFEDCNACDDGYQEGDHPILLFLDINMPVLDGFGFLEKFTELRTQYPIDTCVVIMFTSSEAEADRERALSHEFVADYLVKGEFAVSELREKVLSLV